MDFSNRAYDGHIRDLLPSLCRIIIVNSHHIEPGCSQSTDYHLGMPAGANNGHAGFAVHGCIAEGDRERSAPADWDPVNAGIVAWPSAVTPSRCNTWPTVR